MFMKSGKTKCRIIIFFIFSISYFNVQGQTKTYLLETIPTGADVLNNKDEVIGQTPFDLKNYPKKSDTIAIAKENYDTAWIAFPANSYNRQFPQKVVYCEPCRVEMSTSPDKKDQSGVLVLRKRRMDQDAEDFNIFSAFVDSFKFQIDDTTTVGKIEGNKKKWGDKKIKELADLDYISGFPATTGFYYSYIHATPVDEGNKIYIRFRIKAKFKNLYFDFENVDKYRVKGYNSIDSEWEIYSKYDSINPIAKYNIHSALYRAPNKTNKFITSLIHDAEKQLVAIDTLYDFMSKQDQKILAMSKGEVVTLPPPPHKTFGTLKEINRYASPNVITVEGEKGFGSGFFISGNGYLVTNNHVVEKQKKIKIRINKDYKLDAEVVKTNFEYDLALLKVNYDSVPGLWLADSDSIDAGDPVVAIGTPLDKILSSTLTKGIISGTREFGGIRMIQTDVSINSGNSGGPLINDKGEVIGMSTLKVKANGVEGIGFCIPSNDIKRMLNIEYK